MGKVFVHVQRKAKKPPCVDDAAVAAAKALAAQQAEERAIMRRLRREQAQAELDKRSSTQERRDESPPAPGDDMTQWLVYRIQEIIDSDFWMQATLYRVNGFYGKGRDEKALERRVIMMAKKLNRRLRAVTVAHHVQPTADDMATALEATLSMIQQQLREKKQEIVKEDEHLERSGFRYGGRGQWHG